MNCLNRFTWLAALLMLPALAFAEVRVVDNHGPWDQRLNLRVEPDKGSASLGRYYTGTRVRVLEEDGEWSRVRIEMGTQNVPVEGYMMNAYLAGVEGGSGAGLQPYAEAACRASLTDGEGRDAGFAPLEAGDGIHVLAYSDKRVHVLTNDGRSGFLERSQLDRPLAEPEEEERIVRERCAVAEGGATLRLSPAAEAVAVATLYGGVFLEDAWFLEKWINPLVFLGDTGLGGYLLEGEWTWTDNGASCGCQYDVYRQDGRFVQVIGELADGRLILSCAGEVSAAEAAALDGAQKLSPNPGGSTFAYDGPMPGELGDEEAARCAIEGLLFAGEADEQTGQALTREALLAMRPVVERLVWPQWGEMTSLFVEFVDETGTRRAFAEIDPQTGAFVGNGNG